MPWRPFFGKIFFEKISQSARVAPRSVRAACLGLRRAGAVAENQLKFSKYQNSPLFPRAMPALGSALGSPPGFAALYNNIWCKSEPMGSTPPNASKCGFRYLVATEIKRSLVCTSSLGALFSTFSAVNSCLGIAHFFRHFCYLENFDRIPAHFPSWIPSCGRAPTKCIFWYLENFELGRSGAAKAAARGGPTPHLHIFPRTGLKTSFRPHLTDPIPTKLALLRPGNIPRMHRSKNLRHRMSLGGGKTCSESTSRGSGSKAAPERCT